MSIAGPIYSTLLRFAVVGLLASSALAQGAPKYDPATESTFKGIVEELKLVPPTGGKPIAYLVMKNGQDKVQVFLCPKKFLDEMGVDFKAEESIQVTGSKVKDEAGELTLAREIVKGGDTLTLRFKDGKPAW